MPTISNRKRLYASLQTPGAVLTPFIWAFEDGTTGADIVVPVNSVVQIFLDILASNSAVMDKSFRATVKRGAGALSIVGAPSAVYSAADATAATWLTSFSLGGGQGSFNVNATGVAATVINWEAGLEYRIFSP